MLFHTKIVLLPWPKTFFIVVSTPASFSLIVIDAISERDSAEKPELEARAGSQSWKPRECDSPNFNFSFSSTLLYLSNSFLVRL
jgi:hypothetical protein